LQQDHEDPDVAHEPWEVAPVNSFDKVEKAAAAREARDAVGSAHRRAGSRGDEVAAALVHYLSTEQYHERAAAPHDEDDAHEPDDEPRDSDETS
jgi:hypothetical protein